MFQKLSFLFRKSHRRLLSRVLQMQRAGYTLLDVDSVLQAAKEKKLRGSGIRQLSKDVQKLKKEKAQRKTQTVELPAASPIYPEEMRILDAEYGHSRTKSEHACLDKAGNPVPWYTYAAIEFAKQLDFSDKEVFEFGSGYSTVFWGGRAKKVVAVEHEAEWYARMLPKIPGNVDYRLVTEPARYPRLILEYPGMFDVVIIDGEQRPECVGPAVEKLREDGLIIVDNADWYPGICRMLRAADLIQVDMQGLGPINGYAWTTSYFFRRSARFQPFAARQPFHGPGSLPNMCDLPINPLVDTPSLNQLDEKLAKYLDFRGGFFVEAGANDGYNQSNTYHLENNKGWSGLLVEAIPALAETCCKVRSRSTVCHAALVADETTTPSVTMRYANLMSLVEGSLGGHEQTEEHVRKGVEIQQLKSSYSVEVKARTLSSLLNEFAPGREIDFFSLDVEGFESEVLKGLDLSRHVPRFILVETWKLEEIAALLETHYQMVEKLTVHDYLFQRREAV